MLPPVAASSQADPDSDGPNMTVDWLRLRSATSSIFSKHKETNADIYGARTVII